MSLRQRLGLTTVKRKQTRLDVDAALEQLRVTGSMVLPQDTLLVHRSALGNSYAALRGRQQSDTDKLQAIKAADTAIQAAQAAIAAANGFKKTYVDQFDRLYQTTYAATVKPLQDKVGKEVPGAQYTIPLASELSGNRNDFMIGMRAAKNPQEAKFFFDNAKAGHERIEKELRTLVANPAPLLQAAGDKAASRKAFEALEGKVLALQMANATGADEVVAKLYAANSKLEEGKAAEAKAEFEKLELEVTAQTRSNDEAVKQALAGPRRESQRLRDLLNGYAAGPQGKLATVKGVLATVKQRLDTLDLFLAGNQTAQSAIPANDMASDIAAMLREVGGMDATQDKANKDNMEGVKKALKEKKFVVLQGEGAVAKACFPEEYVALMERQANLLQDMDGMRPSEIKATAETLVKDARALNTKAEGVKNEVATYKGFIKGYRDNLKKLDEVVKKDGATKNDPTLKSNHFAGEFGTAVAALEAAVRAEPPNLAIMAERKAAADNAYTALVPKGGRGRLPGDAEVLASHKQAKQAEAAFAALLADANQNIANAEKASAEAKAAVGRAKPGDQLALKSMQAEVKRSVKLVKAATDEATLTVALGTLEQAANAARQLSENPQGDAPNHRGELTKSEQRWSEAVKKVDDALAGIDVTLGGAPNLDDASKREIRAMLAVARRRFEPGAFAAVVQAMTRDPSNENQPERMKARESGLRLVRQFRDAIGRDPFISSLVQARPFPIDFITEAHQSLNNLDLNLSRAV